jgi:5'(3')-deoxyribonucleotidase
LATVRKTIAIDLDDVLAAHAEAFVAYSNQRWGTHLTVDDYDEHWGMLWKTEYEETNQRAIAYLGSGAVGQYRHEPEAEVVLRRLKSDYDLVIVTSRRNMIRQETEAWIERYFKGIFNAIHFAGMWDNGNRGGYMVSKLDLVQEVGADYLIDDQLKHCLPVAEAGIHAILYGDYAWNQAEQLPKKVTCCKTWAEVEAYFATRG